MDSGEDHISEGWSSYTAASRPPAFSPGFPRLSALSSLRGGFEDDAVDAFLVQLKRNVDAEVRICLGSNVNPVSLSCN